MHSTTKSVIAVGAIVGFGTQQVGASFLDPGDTKRDLPAQIVSASTGDTGSIGAIAFKIDPTTGEVITIPARLPPVATDKSS